MNARPDTSVIPHPDTPVIGDEQILEISNYQIEILGPGIVVFRNVLQFEQKSVLEYIDSRAEESHKNRWTYIVGEDARNMGLMKMVFVTVQRTSRQRP